MAIINAAYSYLYIKLAHDRSSYIAKHDVYNGLNGVEAYMHNVAKL